MNRYSTFLLLSFCLCMSACSSNEVKIRIQNASSSDFTNVIVDTGDRYTYESIAAGEYSQYDIHESAYSYAFIELQILDSTYTIQPIDFVGETLLDSGSYTYRIETTDVSQRCISLHNKQ